MIFKGREGLKLPDAKVRFTKGGVEQEKYVGPEGKQWWLDFAEKWGIVVEFTAATYTDDQLARFDEVKELDLPEGVLSDYVMEGTAGKGLEILALKKENAELKQVVADLTEEILMGGA